MVLKNLIVIIFTLSLVVYLSSCSKKQPPLEQMQQPMSPEELSRLTTQTQNISIPANETTQVAPLLEKKLEPLPPQGPYKPTNKKIQTALKNAGYYTGAIDGKIGPKSKMAIEEFQKANGLTVDGKVGPKTWSVLSKHLNPEPVPADITSTPVTTKKSKRY